MKLLVEFPEWFYLMDRTFKTANSADPGEMPQSVYRGSNMSAHVLLNLLNELGKSDKMRGLSSILPLFRNELNKFNNL